MSELNSISALLNDANLQGYWRFETTEDSNTKLLIHGDGADTSTSILDYSVTPHAITPSGNVQIDTAQKKFGTGSVLFDGNGDYLTVGDHADWALGATWTADFWVRFNALPTAGNQMAVWSQYTDASNRFELTFYNDSGTYYLICNINGGGGNIALNPQPSTGVWYHFAIVDNNQTVTMYQGGTALTPTLSSMSVTDLAADPTIGSRGTSLYFNGWLDEFRIVKGVAKHTGNFTAPTTPYYAGGEDYSANCYHLTQANTPTYSTGKYTNAANFVGASSQALSVLDANCPNLEQAGAQSWGCWFKTAAGVSGRFMTKDDESSGIKALYNNHANHLVYFFINGLTTNTYVASSNTYTDSVWNFVCAVYDPANTKLKIYLNGTKTEVTASGNATDSNQPFRIGSNITTFLTGSIDDAFFFNKALTDAEVTSLYGASTNQGFFALVR